jgi:hypothetical protein
VFVERLWRSVKYEEVYLRADDGVSGTPSSIGGYLTFYNPSGRVRALTDGLRITSTLVAMRRRWRHEFSPPLLGLGYALLRELPQRQSMERIGRETGPL